jgi:hypothetical protein
LYDTIGGYGGCLALGAILAYGAGPEIYDRFTNFPGLWLHGETQQGKSSVARWLMRIWGFDVDAGLALKDSTKVGIAIALQQYGNLPVFLEEFQPNAPDWMVEKIKNIFGRESGSKKTFDEGDRKILTNVIVTGVATCMDAQVRSRYAHVQVSASNRRANHYEWFQAECDKFVYLGRYIMRHRKPFATRVVELLREWMASPAMKVINERSRLVHGAAYAAYAALSELLGLNEVKLLEAFRSYLVEHCTTAVAEVQEQVNVNQFWRDLLDGLKSDAFGVTAGERARVFKVLEKPTSALPPEITAQQRRDGVEDSFRSWKGCYLYFNPGPVIDMLRAYKRRQGRDLPLDRQDLRAQMRTKAYWVEPRKRNGESADAHRQKFGYASKTAELCWCIDMDKHELGFRPVTDEEWELSKYVDEQLEQGTFLASNEWIDPRKGDLFAIVDALKGRESNE